MPQSITNGIPTYNVTTGEAGCQNNALVLGGTNTFAANASPCRFNPYWTSVEFYTAGSNSFYNSLQVQATKRVSHGLDFQVAYTWSRTLDTTQGQMFGDDCAGPGSAIGVSPLNLRLDKGPACFNVPQSLHLNVLYHFPNINSSRPAAKLLQGWWIGNIVSAQGGFPFTPLIGTQRSFDGVITQAPVDRASLNTASTTVTLPVTGGNDTYNFIPYDPKTVITGNPNNWFNPLMFGEAPLGQLGTAGRDILHGPSLIDWDFSIVKDTKIRYLGEAGNLEFRAEIFNMMNHANFNLPASGNVFSGTTALSTAAGGDIQAPTGATVSNPFGTAGQITTTATSSRQIQLALKLEF